MLHVIFVHGIGNKVSPPALTQSWLQALSAGPTGVDLGAGTVSCSMVYWADVLYSAPEPDSTVFRDYLRANRSAVAVPVAANSEEAKFLSDLALKMGAALASVETIQRFSELGILESFPSPFLREPWSAKKIFMETFLRDVHHYLFNVSHSPRPGVTFHVQDEIRKRFEETLLNAPKDTTRHVVLGHSMGSVIAYDCLKRLKGMSVDSFLSIGSPLGLDEIQDRLTPEWTAKDGFPSERLSNRWINFFDRMDPVAAFDPFLADDYQYNGKKLVQDVEVRNLGEWRHSATGYFAANDFRRALRELLEVDGPH